MLGRKVVSWLGLSGQRKRRTQLINVSPSPQGRGSFGGTRLPRTLAALPFPVPTGQDSIALGTFLELEWFLCLQGLHLPNQAGPPPAWAGSSCSLSSLLWSFLFLSLPPSVSASLPFLSLPSPFAFLELLSLSFILPA